MCGNLRSNEVTPQRSMTFCIKMCFSNRVFSIGCHGCNLLIYKMHCLLATYKLTLKALLMCPSIVRSSYVPMSHYSCEWCLLQNVFHLNITCAFWGIENFKLYPKKETMCNTYRWKHGRRGINTYFRNSQFPNFTSKTPIRPWEFVVGLYISI